jgi:hypothetical protein
MNGFPDKSGTWKKDPGNPLVAVVGGRNVQEDPLIILVGSTYHLFYTSSTEGVVASYQICHASTNEVDYPYGWTLNQNNPILAAGTNPQSGIDDYLVAAPELVRMQDGSWRMYYHAWNGSVAVAAMATTSGANFPLGWTKYASNPVLTQGGSGKFDAKYIHPECVIPAWESPDGDWHMFYGGYAATGDKWDVGHAISEDGIAWTRVSTDPVPSLAAGQQSGADQSAYPYGWFKDGSTYYILRMQFDGTRFTTGFASSTNLYDWTLLGAGYVIEESAAGEGFDTGGVQARSAVSHDGQLDIWYVGNTLGEGGTLQSGWRIARAFWDTTSAKMYGAVITGGSIR